MESQSVLVYSKGINDSAQKCLDALVELNMDVEKFEDCEDLQQRFFRHKCDVIFFFYDTDDRESVRQFFKSTRLVKESSLFVGIAPQSSMEIGELDLFLTEKHILTCAAPGDFFKGLFRIHQKARRQSEYAAMLIHDLRSPFQSILSYLELLQDEVFGKLNEGQQQLIDNAERISDMMVDMIDELGDVLRYEEGAVKLLRSRFFVKKLVHEVIQNLWVQADSRNLKFRFNFPDEDIELQADRQALNRVLTNLISNAIQHSPADGSIQISAGVIEEKGQSFVEISVADEGGGISSADAGQVFSKYFRVPKKQRKGFGLGLYIARTLVEAHEGHIGVRETPGGGSTFYFRLPMIRA